MIHDVNIARKSVLGQLMLLTKLIRVDMEQSIGPAGLTMARAQVLWILGAEPGMSQRMLAERLGVTPRNVTTLIDALEQTGFVQRQPHPTDRRATELVLTEQGSAAYAQFQDGQGRFAEALFGDYSEHRLEVLHHELAAVIGTLERLAESERT